MKVLIVAKTHVHGRACVGGLALDDNRPLRLLEPNGAHQPADTPYDVGQIWDLDVEPCPHVTPPHVEDMRVLTRCLVGHVPNMRLLLQRRVQPWRGAPNQTFENLVRPTGNGSGYVNEIMGVPSMSTGFWLPDRSLSHELHEDKHYYRYPRDTGVRLLPYVGFAPPIDLIPAGSLVRLSLARWRRPDRAVDVEYRCFLQLSGWYL
ncbi:MAG: dual OB domain-containing protein [Chloroflexia bacterium]